MITNHWIYLLTLIVIVLLAWWIDEKKQYKIFSYIPVVVILYITTMVLANINLWTFSEKTNTIYSSVRSYVLPMMILALLMGVNIKSIASMGKQMLGVFFLASLSIALGFIIAFLSLKNFLPAESWRALGALSGSWMGGTANMVAIGDGLGASDAQMGFALISDSFNYTIWVTFLLLIIPLAPRFDKWSKANMKNFENIVSMTPTKKEKYSLKIQISSIIFLYLIVELILKLSSMLPESDFFTRTTWIVLICTLTAIIGGITPLARFIPSWIGKPLLYLLIALIASKASLEDFTQAPLFIAFGTVVLVIHFILMLIFAKIFKLNLFSLGVASLANIGGVASAPILAGAYAKNLIPIGVLMAMLGYIVGTFGGLMVGKILYLVSFL